MCYGGDVNVRLFIMLFSVLYIDDVFEARKNGGVTAHPRQKGETSEKMQCLSLQTMFSKFTVVCLTICLLQCCRQGWEIIKF